MTKLEEILKERGIKQIWLAKKIKKHTSELNRYIKGKRIPRYKTMCIIAEVLNLKVEDIFFDNKVSVSTNKNNE